MQRTAWHDGDELRVGLGCMRLWADGGDAAAATVAAALAAGITVFDTARAYEGPHREPGGNERALASALKHCNAARVVRIVTKGGMRRDGVAWVPDGRARAIAADCEASLAALDGIAIDLYLTHAPDPRTPWRTSVRGLAKLLDRGLVRHVGLSNVNRMQLEQALDVMPVAAVEVSLSPFDDTRLRDGTVAFCEERGITVIAHRPLGGQHKARTLARHAVLRGIAERHAVAAAEVALRWLLDLGGHIVAIPGATRPNTVRSTVHATGLRLDDTERAALRGAFGAPRAARAEGVRSRVEGEVVLIMGIPGAGKSRVAEAYVARGHLRLNRDLRGGSLRQLCAALDEALTGGQRTAVLDNTWLTRAVRSEVVDVARRHGVAVRCVWLDITLAEAQRNVVERVLERFGTLPAPEELRRLNGRDGLLTPTSQMRALRELEPPAMDEGFVDVEHRTFARDPVSGGVATAVFIATAALRLGDVDAVLRTQQAERHLVFEWRPDADAGALIRDAERIRVWTGRPVATALCPHPAGAPVCWCRPPLLGLILQFARQHRVELSRSLLIGTSTAHRTMARILGCHFVTP